MSYRPFSPSLFGPYRKFYEDKLRQLNGSARASLSQVTEEEANSEVIVNKDTRTKTDFSAFHKKQNIKFLKDSSSRRNDRMNVFQEGIKAKRNQILMEKRKCVPMTTTKDTSQGVNTNKKMNDGGNGRETAKESRKEQLQRWKKEKEAALIINKANVKPPFKGGQTKPSVAAKGLPMDTNGNNNKPRLENPTSRPMSAPAVGLHSASQVVNPKDNSGGARRVTRAMSKAQSGPNPVAKPPVSKMQTLTISGKNKSDSSNSVNSNASKNSDLSSIASEIKKVETADAQKSIEVIVPPVPVKAPKKLKPKAIDEVYIEFNATFSKACEELRNLSNEWKNIVEWPDIPEDIREDMICSIGQAKLLLDSKLPQFCQLLYSYLCREADPGLILPCDLQGWWDVASIQVEAVKSQFGRLKKLQMSAWVQELELPLTQPSQTNKLFVSKSENKVPVEPKRKPVQASQGIREFLAKKRNIKVEAQTAADKVVTSTSPEKKFEGGFFEVKSPVKVASATRMTTRFSILKDSPNSNTPSRRTSSTNVSLRMLSVRKSMGSICKIGVVSSDEAIGQDATNFSPPEN